MPQPPEAPKQRPKDIFARSYGRLAATRLAGRGLLIANRRSALPGVSLLEFMPSEPAALDYIFNSTAWRYTQYFFNTKSLRFQYAKKYRREELNREKRSAQLTTLGFVNRHVQDLKSQRDNADPEEGRRMTVKAFGGSVVAYAVMGQHPPIKTHWQIHITNRRDDLSVLEVQTTNAKTAGSRATDVNAGPKQWRVPYMAMINPNTAEPYQPPNDVAGRTALYQTVETAFAVLGCYGKFGGIEDIADFAPIAPDELSPVTKLPPL